jgi:glycosyltransferase Alg8
MYRWYGNNLRQNSRALGLGLRRLGLFTSIVLFDQRVSMWTSLLGLTVAGLLALLPVMSWLSREDNPAAGAAETR